MQFFIISAIILILRTGKKSNIGGTEIITSTQYMNHYYEHFGLSSDQEMVFYLETLIPMGLIEKIGNEANEKQGAFQSKVQFPARIKITFKGLQRIYELENKGELSNKCFVAMFLTKREMND